MNAESPQQNISVHGVVDLDLACKRGKFEKADLLLSITIFSLNELLVKTGIT